jgi:hypothetical protein
VSNRRAYTFVTVYDNLLDHPAWMDLGVEHIGTWVLALGYCRRRKTDGHFPDKATARRWGADAETVDALVAAGRFHRPGHECPDCPQPAAGDLYVHAYLEHQSSKAEQDALSAKRAEAGRKGGQRRHEVQAADLQGKQVAKQVADTVQSNVQATASKPEPEGEGEREKDSPARERAAAAAADFETWWEHYPRKVGKAAAAKAYAKAHGQVGADALRTGLVASLTEWRAARTEPQYLPHPATWLNQGRWADEHPHLEGTDQPAGRPTITANQCDGSACPGGRHEWTDARNRFVCMGVEA